MNPQRELARFIRRGRSMELGTCHLIQWLKNKGEIDRWSMIDPEQEAA